MHLAGLPLAPEDGEKGRRCERSSSPAMCSVSEAGSTDPLVARFRQVEETLEKLHRENRSLKSKVPRYNALCTLYHESAQQLKHLQLQLAAKDATVRELRGSLARQQQQQQQQQQAGVGEAGAEPARSLVESLLEQLGQARERLRDSERHSALRVEALSQVRRRGAAGANCEGRGTEAGVGRGADRRSRGLSDGMGAASGVVLRAAVLRTRSGALCAFTSLKCGNSVSLNSRTG